MSPLHHSNSEVEFSLSFFNAFVDDYSSEPAPSLAANSFVKNREGRGTEGKREMGERGWETRRKEQGGAGGRKRGRR